MRGAGISRLAQERASAAQEWLAAMQPTLDRMREQAQAHLRLLQPTVDRMTARTGAIASAATVWLAENGPAIAEMTTRMRRWSAEAHVENWDGLDEDQWLAAIELMRDDAGVPLAWVPPAGVVELLVDAPDHAARTQILLDHSARIEARARECLAAVTHDNLRHLKGALAEAWDAYAAGLRRSAQSLAASCVSDIINHHYSQAFGQFRDAVKPFRERNVELWEITELRHRAVLCSVSTVVHKTKDGFPGFNRHATVHGLNPEQFTHANALHGLMVATAAARELQFVYADEWETAPSFTPPPQASSLTKNIKPIPKPPLNDAPLSAPRFGLEHAAGGRH